jgi:hypothetical protein
MLFPLGKFVCISAQQPWRRPQALGAKRKKTRVPGGDAGFVQA